MAVSLTERAFLYVVGHRDGPQKVGYSIDPPKRVRGIRDDASDQTLPIYRTFPVYRYWAGHAERMAHWLLREHHWRLEWFNCTPEQAAEAAERAAGLHYAGTDHIPTTCRPNKLYDEMLTLRLRKGTLARMDAATGTPERAQFVREAIDAAIERHSAG